MTQQATPEQIKAVYEESKDALTKLPILGPALWLYAKDPVKKFMFMGDLDWQIFPPVILDQCRLFTRDVLPYAFITWACVSDEIDARLRTGNSKIAPHEWKSGEHIWIIDAIAPFGELQEALESLRANQFKGKTVNAFLPDPKVAGSYHIQSFAAINPQ